MAILAIDQGQTKTAALLLSEEGEILGTGKAGGASHYKDGLAKASGMMQEAADMAIQDAGLQKEAISQVYGGIAAANWPDEIEMLQEELKRRFSVQKADVVNDCVIALRAGTDSDNAIVLCTGSGMNSAVFVNGKLELVYNNYIDFYDQGSEGLSSRALREIFQSHMGCGPYTSLTEGMKEYFGIDDMDRLMLAFYRNQLPKPLKDACEVVFQEANKNDPTALEVIYEFGKSISQYVTGAVKRFQIEPAGFEVILSGGVFKNSNPLLYETVCSQIHRKYSNIPIKQSFYEPIIGAALLAFDEKGAKDDDAHERCKKEACARGLVRY
ncbi:MAG TPA: hypothetical protein IAB44_04625 [Candidatus Limivivens intestinipullorum]|uniref:ATPase BadF/BadG/BcrA/BcrD type domain-containing protein n=1 Tax=Candidatus Limivivens intestinipullorum TaxID=2840858 RepID=A0A9D1ERX7_9FIRM|nr:hypothetical protein [Candidatus Limivivens intestinipullorum]